MCTVKRNFLFTKKGLAEYLNISRVTLDKRLPKYLNLNDPHAVIDWLMFEGLGTGRIRKNFSDFIYRTKGEFCEMCKVKNNLQITHIEPRSFAPELTFIASNVRVLCVNCHNKTERSQHVGEGKNLKITKILVRNPLQ